MIHSRNPQTKVRLVINRATSDREGQATADKLSMVAKRFLDMEISKLGYVMDDDHVTKAVKQQRPYFLAFPQSQASKSIRNLVAAYLGSAGAAGSGSPGGLKGFFKKLKGFIP